MISLSTATAGLALVTTAIHIFEGTPLVNRALAADRTPPFTSQERLVFAIVWHATSVVLALSSGVLVRSACGTRSPDLEAGVGVLWCALGIVLLVVPGIYDRSRGVVDWFNKPYWLLLGLVGGAALYAAREA